jgi:hypothetical protein
MFTSPLHRNGSSSTVACVFISVGTCLPSRCLAVNVCSGSATPAFRRHVTVSYRNVSNDQVKEVKVDRACSTHEVKRNAYGILVRKPEGRRPLGRLRRRLEDNIKMGRREKWMGVMEWSHLAQDRDQLE